MSENEPTVLVVDDNETNRDVLSRRIERYGYKTKMATNGREALQMIRSENFDLVLLDIMMPELNGYQVLERIKQDPDLWNLPVIVISALDDIDSIVKCIQLGAEDYLSKPFNPLILRARVTASLEKKRLRDKEEEHREEQSINQRVDRELSARLSMQNAADIMLEWAMERTTAHAGFFARVYNGGENVRVISYKGTADGIHYYQQSELPVDSDEMGRAIKTIMPQISVERDDYLLHSTKSRLILPVGRGGQIIGLLLLEDENTERYDSKTLAFLTRLSDRAAIAMANALLYEQVQKANQDKGEFISTVSHELKNPMTSIQNYAKMISDMGPVNDMQAQFINTIISNVGRMSKLVMDLLDLSHMESGHLSLNLEQITLADVFQETTMSLQGQIDQKGQTLVLEMPQDLPTVHADKDRLIQVMTNLVSNAHKYTPENGELKIVANIHPQHNGSTPSVCIAVQDNGIGLRKEDQEKIFSDYFRAADQHVAQTPGTGLGLKITKQLVEIQGGEIWFESEYQKGTTFFFTVPMT